MPEHTNSCVWLITGCSTGFDRAFAEAVLQHGDSLLGSARSAEALQGLEEQFPTQVRIISLDVTKTDDAYRAVQMALSTFGQIDVPVNDTGYGMLGAIEETSDSEMRRMFETSFFGSLTMIQAALAHICKQGHGHISNMSSITSFVGNAGLSAYCGSMFALEGLLEALVAEVAPLGIQATIVEPGNFRTDWAGGSMTHIEQKIGAYSAICDGTAAFLTGMHEQHPSDPACAAQSLFKIVEIRSLLCT
ncbi:short-chain dehydrogenase/reductase [Ktedonobacter sp. SOSP1-52]|uniref:SDR family NAD(P)-dependent oxidoreductase n=1 Tax=Ktedonobacter sp. SOSP1-52 TaxID=2778366 RepID=UPI001916A449|nr:SDR family NAD(P)-dependent oxidoreductase [Ktedonobacter sp. SOSP1-52]GHO71723.1 short-chain dehydrogenase/reductase [Ktedonobacter sp. SOSP1-52]